MLWQSPIQEQADDKGGPGTAVCKSEAGQGMIQVEYAKQLESCSTSPWQSPRPQLCPFCQGKGCCDARLTACHVGTALLRRFGHGVTETCYYKAPIGYTDIRLSINALGEKTGQNTT